VSITIRKYRSEYADLWDEFVQSSNNGTIFQQRRFLAYHLDRSFTDHSLIFMSGEKILALFPAAEVQEGKHKILFSHPGSSFGGLVFRQLSYHQASEILQQLEMHCRETQIQKLFLIPSPSVYFRKPDDTVEYAMIWQGYQIAEWYISSVIDLTQTADVMELIHPRKRRYLQGLLANGYLTLRWENDFSTFYPILQTNKERHRTRPTHSLEELENLDRLLPGKLKLLLLYYRDQPVGGTLNFIANDRTIVIFYNMMDYNYQHLQPASVQVYHTLKWAHEAGFHYVDFGVSHNPAAANPLTPQPSLIRFKEQFGARGMLRKAFVKTI